MQNKKLAINATIPNLMIARLVQFWPWQFDVWTTSMTAQSSLTFRNEAPIMEILYGAKKRLLPWQILGAIRAETVW